MMYDYSKWHFQKAHVFSPIFSQICLKLNISNTYHKETRISYKDTKWREGFVYPEKLHLACWPGSQLVCQVGPCAQPSGNVYRVGKTPEMWLWTENLGEMISPPSPSEGVKKQRLVSYSFIHSTVYALMATPTIKASFNTKLNTTF